MRRRRRAALLATAASAALAVARCAEATDTFWQNPGGGSFADPSNWLNNQPPGTPDNVYFKLPGATYQVNFGATARTGNVFVGSNTVQLNLGGFNYAVGTPAQPGDFNLGLVAGDVSAVSVTNGLLTLSSWVRLGSNAGTTGILSASGGDSGFNIQNTLLDGEAGVGQFNLGHGATARISIATLGLFGGASGSMNITEGAAVTLKTTSSSPAQFNIGYGNGGTGTVSVDGVLANSPSTVNVSGTTIVALEGNGTLNVSNGAQFTTVGLQLGNKTGSGTNAAILNIDGVNGTWRSAVHVTQAGTNLISGGATSTAYVHTTATVNVSHGALLAVDGSLTLGVAPLNFAAVGNMTIGGAANGFSAEVNVAKDLRITFGSVDVLPGGRLTVGGTCAPNGALIVDGGDVVVNNMNTIGYISNGPNVQFRSGSFTINGTATLTGNSTTLSASDPTADVVLNLGPNATFQAQSIMGIGGSWTQAGNRAVLNIGPGAVFTGNQVGAFRVWSQGTVNVNGGTFSVGSISATGAVNWNSGTIQLTNAFTFPVGSNGLYGKNLTLGPDKGLSVSGTIPIDADSKLTLAGGFLSAGAVVPPGGFLFRTTNFTWTGGTLVLTGADKYIDPSSELGAHLVLDSGYALGASRNWHITSGSTLVLNAASALFVTSGTSGVTIDAGGSVTLNGGRLTYGSITNNGSLVFNSGTMNPLNDVTIDQGMPLVTGTITNGQSVILGTVSSTTGYGSRSLNVGGTGAASFAQQGGELECSTLYLGQSTSGTGQYTLSAGKLGAATTYVGDNSAGTLLQSGGTFVGTNLDVSFFAPGLYAISGGTASISGNVTIGDQTSGTVSLSGGVLSGGTVTVGMNQPGLLQQTGGAFQAMSLMIGRVASAPGTYSISNGTLLAGDTHVASSGTATLSIGAGAIVSGTNGFIAAEGVKSAVGSVSVGGAGASWALSGDLRVGAPITGTSSGHALLSITSPGASVSVGNQFIIAPTGTVTLLDGVLSAGATTNNGTINHFGGTVTLGAISGTGSVSVGSAAGSPATMKVASIQQGSVSIGNTGSLVILPDVVRLTHSIGTLAISGNGSLDIANHDLLVNGTSYAAVNALVKQAAGAATGPLGLNPWNGNGITSLLVKSDANGGHALQSAIGVVDHNDFAANGSGKAVAAGKVLVSYAAYGDANLDNTVDIADLSIWNNNFATGNHWGQGDFNYDGAVDIADLSIWNNNFAGKVTPSAATAAPRTFAAAPKTLSGSTAVGAPVAPATPPVNTLELDIDSTTGDAVINSGGVSIAAVEIDSAAKDLITGNWKSFKNFYHVSGWSFTKGVPNSAVVAEFTSDASSSGTPIALAQGSLTDYGNIVPVGFSNASDLTFKYNIVLDAAGNTQSKIGNVVITGGVPEPASLGLPAVGGIGLLTRRRRRRKCMRYH